MKRQFPCPGQAHEQQTQRNCSHHQRHKCRGALLPHRSFAPRTWFRLGSRHPCRGCNRCCGCDVSGRENRGTEEGQWNSQYSVPFEKEMPTAKCMEKLRASARSSVLT